MVTHRESAKRWLTEVIEPRCPELLPPIHAVMDAADRIEEQRCVTEADLDAILFGIRSSRLPLYEYTSNVVSRLTADFEEVRAVLVELSEDKSAQVRFNTILCLGKESPPALAEQIVRKGFTDRSTKVRTKAADWMLRLRLKSLVPDLEEAILHESNAKVRSAMEFTLGLVRDKYLLRPSHDGYDLIIQSEGILSRSITQQQLDDEGIEAIVERFYREDAERAARWRSRASGDRSST